VRHGAICAVPDSFTTRKTLRSIIKKND
jgi:hypothetical protein